MGFFLLQLLPFFLLQKWVRLMVSGSWISLPTSEVTSVVLFTKLHLLHTDVSGGSRGEQMSQHIFELWCHNFSKIKGNKNSTFICEDFDGKNDFKVYFQSCSHSRTGLLFIKPFSSSCHIFFVFSSLFVLLLLNAKHLTS